MPQVSVIIAACNTGAYIEECIRSVLCQSLKDIEIIAVDDCSADDTAEKIAALAEHDARITLIRHEENKSALRTRKTGLLHAHGKYVMFLDGDDLYTPDACRTALEAAERENADIVEFGAERFADQNAHRTKAADVPDDPVRTVTRTVSSQKSGLLSTPCFGMGLSFKIYRREIALRAAAELPDESLHLGEDWMFTYFLFYYAHSYACIPQRLYRYRIGTGISTGDLLPRRKIDALCKLYGIYLFLERWTREQGTLEECAEILGRLREAWLCDIAVNFLNSCKACDREYFAQKVLEFCPCHTFLAALYTAVYDKQAADPAALAEACTVLPGIRNAAKKTSVKTIGAFYGRIRNGGIENVMCKLANLWTENGYRVVLFTSEEPSADDYALNPDVRRVVLPAPAQRSLACFEQRTASWETLLREYGIDMMVYHAWLDPLMPADIITVKNTGTPLIVHSHGLFCSNLISLEIRYVYTNVMLSRYYAYADLVVALSETDEAWWKSCGIPCIRTMNPTGLTLDAAPSPLNGHNIVFVGRITPEKQLLDTLRILQLVRRKVPDATLTVVGCADDEEYEKQVHRFAEENDLQDAVIFAGYCRDVLPYYQNAAAALCTSRYEGQSLAISEELICGLPIVSYELPNSDFLRRGEGIFAVRQNDVQGAADALAALLTDDEMRRSAGRRARQSAEKAFGMDLAAHWDTIFSAALSPAHEDTMLSRRPPLETAIGLLNEYAAEGIRARTGGEGLSGDSLYYRMQCNALNKTIEELRSSSSYRLGCAVLSIPKKLKKLFGK